MSVEHAGRRKPQLLDVVEVRHESVDRLLLPRFECASVLRVEEALVRVDFERLHAREGLDAVCAEDKGQGARFKTLSGR